jgi:hypothetical protein
LAQTFPVTVTHVVRNGYFGAPDEFDLIIRLFREVSRDVRGEVTLARMDRVLSALNLHDDDALW